MMCKNLNVSFLGKVPLDPQIGNLYSAHFKKAEVSSSSLQCSGFVILVTKCLFDKLSKNLCSKYHFPTLLFTLKMLINGKILKTVSCSEMSSDSHFCSYKL